MYEDYANFKETPAGAVLEHIMKKTGVSQNALAQKAGIVPQGIDDLINGRRRFTPEISTRLEKIWGIDCPGLFCVVQTNYDVFLRQNEEELKITPELSKFHRSRFWDTKMELVNWVRDYKWVIKRIFEFGNEEEMSEIIHFYGKEKVKQVLDNITDTWWKSVRENNRKTIKV